MPVSDVLDARILILDDEPANVLMLQALLEKEGFTSLRVLTDSRQAFTAFSTFDPDLLLLDLHMPHLDGFAVLEGIRARTPQEVYLPVLVLTADIAIETKRRALSSGATDFLTKPFDVLEVLLRCRNLLLTRRLYQELQRQNERLDERVRERTWELQEAQRETLERLARVTEYRDDVTGEHTRRVGDLSARIAQAMGSAPEEVERIRLAAPLHDLGKAAISDALLLKPGRLLPEEMRAMQTHAQIGASILTGSRSELLRLAEEIAQNHHERWDGHGYPAGLVGAAIPLASRIVAVADVFDALTHARPYKEAWSVAAAVAEIQRLSGTQFDPAVVTAFLMVVAAEGIEPALQNAA